MSTKRKRAVLLEPYDGGLTMGLHATATAAGYLIRTVEVAQGGKTGWSARNEVAATRS